MVEIPVAGLRALVDDEDFPVVRPYRWRLSGQGYAVTTGPENRFLSMHRLIAQPPDGLQIDHRNGERLDNRRANLRIATISQNGANRKKDDRPMSSRYKGVSWGTRKKRWVVQIQRDGRRTNVGWFQDEEDAARAYDEAARVLFGEFALTNFPSGRGPQDA